MSNTQTTTANRGGTAHPVQDAMHELGRAGRDAASEVLGAARESATERIEKGKKQVVAARDQLAGYIAENPVKSVLIASAAGALLGAILARRR